MLAEGGAGVGIEDAFVLEAGERIGIEDLRPLVGVVAGGVAGAAAEEVVEAAHHRGRRCFERREVVGEHLTVHGVEILAEEIGQAGVELEIELGEGQLAHESGRAHVVFRGDHLGEELLGDRLVGLEVACEEIQRFPVPAEILHDLGRELDEIPRHVRARQGFHGDLAEQAVQQVAEFMENRFHLAMGQQRRLAIDGRAHIPDDQAEVRLAERAGVQRVHPRAAAFGLARVPVGVERAKVRGRFRIVNLVEPALGMPGLDRAHSGFQLADGDAEKPGADLEHAGHHAIHREIRTQHLLVEIIVFLALLLGPVSGLPRLQQVHRLHGFGRLILGEQLVLGKERGVDPGVEILDEGERRASRFRHPAQQGEIGEMLVAQDFGLLVAEFEDAPDQRGVVERAGRADLRGSFPHLAANLPVMQVLHDGEHRRELQCEAPGVFMALCAGIRRRSGARGLGQARQLGLVGDDQFPRIGGVEHMLGILLRDLGKLGLDRGDPRLFLRRQVRAGIPETFQRFLDEALLDRRKRADLGTATDGLDHLPQAVVQRQRGVKIRDLRKHPAERLALCGAVAHGVQVIQPAPAVVERLAGIFKGKEGGLETGGRGILRADHLDVFPCEFQRPADVRLDGFRHKGGPADVEIRGEEGMHEMDGSVGEI